MQSIGQPGHQRFTVLVNLNGIVDPVVWRSEIDDLAFHGRHDTLLQPHTIAVCDFDVRPISAADG
jgi:hypothetical protein